MNELMGSGLDAAVAAALGVRHKVLVGGGQAVVAQTDGNGHVVDWYEPSTETGMLSELMTAHSVTVIREPNPEGDWVAGFNFFASHGYESTATDCLDHAARGTTPSVAVCRAVVRRHQSQQEDAAWRASGRAYIDSLDAVDQPALAAALDAEQQDKGARLREALGAPRVFPAKPTGAR